MRKILFGYWIFLCNSQYYPMTFEGYVEQGMDVQRWRIEGEGCVLHLHVSRTDFNNFRFRIFGEYSAKFIKETDINPCLPTTAADDPNENIKGEIIPENGFLGCRLDGLAFAIYEGLSSKSLPVQDLNRACRLIYQKRAAVAKKLVDFESEYPNCVFSHRFDESTCLVRVLKKGITISNNYCELELFVGNPVSAVQAVVNGIDPCVAIDGPVSTKQYWKEELKKDFLITAKLFDRSLVCFVDGFKYARYAVKSGASKENDFIKTKHWTKFCRSIIEKYKEMMEKNPAQFGFEELLPPSKLGKVVRYKSASCELDLFVDREYTSPPEDRIEPCITVGDQSSTNAYWKEKLGRIPKVTAEHNIVSNGLDCFVDGVRYAQYRVKEGAPNWFDFVKEKQWTEFCREIIGKYLQMITRSRIPLKIYAFKSRKSIESK